MAGGASNSFRGLTRGASSGGGGVDAPIPSGTMGAPGAPPSKPSAPSIVRYVPMGVQRCAGGTTPLPVSLRGSYSHARLAW